MQKQENWSPRGGVFLPFVGGFLSGILTSWLGLVTRRHIRRGREDTQSSERKLLAPKSNSFLEPPNETTRVRHDYQVYSTDPLDFQTWVDVLFSKLRLPTPIVATGLGLAVFFAGLVLANTIDFQYEYLGASPVYIGSFGIAWVTGIIRYASLAFHPAYEELRPCFLVDDATYKKVIDHWYGKLSNDKSNILWVAGFFAAACAVVYLAFYRPDILQSLHIESLRPIVFPSYWFTPENLHVKASIITFYGLCVAFPLATAARLLVINFLFLLSLRDFPVVPLGNIIRIRLRRITNLYTFVSVTWSVGVALFGIILFEDLDLFSILGLLALGSLGTLTFLTPQIIFMNFILCSNRIASQWTLAALCERLNIELRERQNLDVSIEIGAEIAAMDDLAGFVEASGQSPLWVYDPSDFLFLLVAQAISLSGVFFEDFMRSLF